MFHRNNEEIDFIGLTERVLVEKSMIHERGNGSPRAGATTQNVLLKLANHKRFNVFRHLNLFQWLKKWFLRICKARRASYDLLSLALVRPNKLAETFIHLEHTLESTTLQTNVLMSQFEAMNEKLSIGFDSSARDFYKLAHDFTDLKQGLVDVRREIMFQQRRLTRLVLSEEKVSRPGQEHRSIVVDRRLDALYVAFEDTFRGSRDDIKKRLQPYVDQLRRAGVPLVADCPVLDVGCGRGEWIELLRDENIPAYGIDLNSTMVERAAALGLNALQVDLLEHFGELEDASRSAVTAFHLVEHLPFEVLVDFLDEVLRALVPGGVLILETPNPETMKVGATTFYNDPTHRNPIPPLVLKFLVEQRGFEEAEVIKLHPFTQGLLTAGTEDAALLNRVLFGPQDYAVIGRRY